MAATHLRKRGNQEGVEPGLHQRRIEVDAVLGFNDAACDQLHLGEQLVRRHLRQVHDLPFPRHGLAGLHFLEGR